MGKEVFVRMLRALTSPWMVAIWILSLPVLLAFYNVYRYESTSDPCEKHRGVDHRSMDCQEHE